MLTVYLDLNLGGLFFSVEASRDTDHRGKWRVYHQIIRANEEIGTFRSDYEYEFFNVCPVGMPDCVRLSRQLVLSSKSRRRLDTNYEIFNKSRPPTTSSLQVQRRVKRLVFKRRYTVKCSVQLVLQCFGDFVASCVVCLLNIPATDKML